MDIAAQIAEQFRAEDRRWEVHYAAQLRAGHPAAWRGIIRGIKLEN
jgi:hypothetical protein